MRILFVCTGNICRSPLAEALGRKLFTEHGRPDVEVSSAGTAAVEGSPASEGAYLVALENGLDIGAHQARFLTRELVEEQDLILGMGTHHVQRANALGGGGRTWLLGEFAGRAADEAEVEDPFGGTIEDYRLTWEQLDDLLAEAVARVLDERSKT